MSRKGKSVVILGAQWGDEGKGMEIDLESEHADFTVRCAGGNNAGHTIYVDGQKLVLHQIPSCVANGRTIGVLSPGMVIDPMVLGGELDRVRALIPGFDAGSRIMISAQAHVICPWHIAEDVAGEWVRANGKGGIGTTGRGIGPAYAAKMRRYGSVRMMHLVKPHKFVELVHENVERINELCDMWGLPADIFDQHPVLARFLRDGGFNGDPILAEYQKLADRIAPMVVADTPHIVRMAIREGANVLFEGAQGTMLDIDHGTFPFVTSSNTVAGGICTGAGVPPNMIDAVYGVMKAYTTRVGGGPFPTELLDVIGDFLAERGNEFGSTTGRKRRCGWLDLVQMRLARDVNGLDGLVVTKLDVLDELPEIKVCVAYDHPEHGHIEIFPPDISMLEGAVPEYDTLPGWQCSTKDVRTFDALPVNAQRYIQYIEDNLGVPAAVISVGPERDQTIVRQPLFG